MKVENDKIVECTEAELFVFWLNRWSKLIDYYTFKERCKELGTKIIKED